MSSGGIDMNFGLEDERLQERTQDVMFDIYHREIYPHVGLGDTGQTSTVVLDGGDISYEYHHSPYPIEPYRRAPDPAPYLNLEHPDGIMSAPPVQRPSAVKRAAAFAAGALLLSAGVMDWQSTRADERSKAAQIAGFEKLQATGNFPYDTTGPNIKWYPSV